MSEDVLFDIEAALVLAESFAPLVAPTAIGPWSTLDDMAEAEGKSVEEFTAWINSEDP